jgi:hypothetical protein
MHWFCSKDPNVKEKGVSASICVKIALRRNPLSITIQTTGIFFLQREKELS